MQYVQGGRLRSDCSQATSQQDPVLNPRAALAEALIEMVSEAQSKLDDGIGGIGGSARGEDTTAADIEVLQIVHAHNIYPLRPPSG